MNQVVHVIRLVQVHLNCRYHHPLVFLHQTLHFVHLLFSEMVPFQSVDRLEDRVLVLLFLLLLLLLVLLANGVDQLKVLEEILFIPVDREHLEDADHLEVALVNELVQERGVVKGDLTLEGVVTEYLVGGVDDALDVFLLLVQVILDVVDVGAHFFLLILLLRVGRALRLIQPHDGHRWSSSLLALNSFPGLGLPLLSSYIAKDDKGIKEIFLILY